MKRRRAGFTLLELMIVIFIIAILMAVLIPNWIKAKYRAHLSGCLQNERSIAAALEVYRTEFDQYPGPGPINPGHVLFTGRYIQPSEVRCPSNQSFYTLQSDSLAYTIECQGIHHLFPGLGVSTAGYPIYSNSTGLSLNP